MFKIIKTGIEDLLIIEPHLFKDNRGYFTEIFNENDFNNLGLNFNFVQINESKSKYGVLRGLHFQRKYPQGKLLRVLDGEIFDVAVDLRKNSKTYGKWIGVFLSSDNHKQFLIPKGFAHGFLVLSKKATIVYKCDQFYHPEDEDGIIYNDPDLNIQWPKVRNIFLSEKDKKHKSFKESNISF